MALELENRHKIAHLYDEEAPAYDGDYSDPLTLGGDNVFRIHFQREFAEVQSRTKGDRPVRLLDMGCGTGIVPAGVGTPDQVPPFIDLTNPQIDYTGLDLSHGMLVEAQHKDPRAYYVEADMGQMPFADNSFSMIVSGYGPFSYALDPERQVSEMVRVLEPGGRVFIMPYTSRLGSGIATGFSTAHMDSVDKNFYNEKLMRELLSKDFENIRMYGINFAGHFIQQASNALRGSAEPEYVARQIRSMMQFAHQHIRQNGSLHIEDLQRMLSEYKELNLMQNSEQPYQGPGFRYLRAETYLAHLLRIDPGFARHMIVVADLKSA